MNKESELTNWFPDDMTDEAACAIHLFLAEFSQHFEDRYYSQIRRHIQFLKNDGRQQEADSDSIYDDDIIPF